MGTMTLTQHDTTCTHLTCRSRLCVLFGNHQATIWFAEHVQAKKKGGGKATGASISKTGGASSGRGRASGGRAGGGRGPGRGRGK